MFCGNFGRLGRWVTEGNKLFAGLLLRHELDEFAYLANPFNHNQKVLFNPFPSVSKGLGTF